MNDFQNRSNKMNLMNEDLARAQMSARLGEAHEPVSYTHLTLPTN